MRCHQVSESKKARADEKMLSSKREILGNISNNAIYTNSMFIYSI